LALFAVALALAGATLFLPEKQLGACDLVCNDHPPTKYELELHSVTLDGEPLTDISAYEAWSPPILAAEGPVVWDGTVGLRAWVPIADNRVTFHGTYRRESE
jgi:hypothetical protein